MSETTTNQKSIIALSKRILYSLKEAQNERTILFSCDEPNSDPLVAIVRAHHHAQTSKQKKEVHAKLIAYLASMNVRTVLDAFLAYEDLSGCFWTWSCLKRIQRYIKEQDSIFGLARIEEYLDSNLSKETFTIDGISGEGIEIVRIILQSQIPIQKQLKTAIQRQKKKIGVPTQISHLSCLELSALREQDVSWHGNETELTEAIQNKSDTGVKPRCAGLEIGLRLWGPWTRIATQSFLKHEYTNNKKPEKIRFIMGISYDDVASHWGQGTSCAWFRGEKEAQYYYDDFPGVEDLNQAVLNFWDEYSVWRGTPEAYRHHRSFWQERQFWGKSDPILKEYEFVYRSNTVSFGSPFLHHPIPIRPDSISRELRIAQKICSLPGANPTWATALYSLLTSKENSFEEHRKWAVQQAEEGNADLLSFLFPIQENKRVFLSDTDALKEVLSVEDSVYFRNNVNNHTMNNVLPQLAKSQVVLRGGWSRYFSVTHKEIEEDRNTFPFVDFFTDAPFSRGDITGEDRDNLCSRYLNGLRAREVNEEERCTQTSLVLFQEDDFLQHLSEYTNLEYLYTDYYNEGQEEILTLSHLKELYAPSIEFDIPKLYTSCPQLSKIQVSFSLEDMDYLSSRAEIENHMRDLEKVQNIVHVEEIQKILSLLSIEDSLQQGIEILKQVRPNYLHDMKQLFRINRNSQYLHNEDLQKLYRKQSEILGYLEDRDITHLHLSWVDSFTNLQRHTGNPSSLTSLLIETTIIEGTLDLSSFHNLESITLSGIPGLISVNCTGLSKLQHCILHNNKHLESIEGLETCLALRELIITSTLAAEKEEDDTFYVNYKNEPPEVLGYFDPKFCMQIRTLANLETLDVNMHLHHKSQQNKHIYDGSFVELLPKLTHAILIGFTISNAIRFPASIEEIDISNGFIEDMAMFTGCHRLRMLAIMWCNRNMNCPITDLRSLPHLPSLEALVLARLPNLESLDGIASLGSLKTLYIHLVPNTLDLRPLKNLSQLHYLDLTGTPFFPKAPTYILMGSEIQTVCQNSWLGTTVTES